MSQVRVPAFRHLDPGRIHRLPPEVAEVIAAGEVIERPASVLKELLENSLDAGARSISVEIDTGGRDLVRVSDDGGGMAAGELGAAFERYATSKLARVEDLQQLATLGFRGEALASIAAVAQVVAISRQGESDRANEVTAGPSGLRGPVVTAGPVGTTFSVRELFHNVPARRAFLRSARSEAAACLRVVADAAVGHPEVRFELRSQGRLVLHTAGKGDQLEAIVEVFGPQVAPSALSVAHLGGDVGVSGFICAPSATLAGRQGLVLFVNGRRLQQRSLSAAVEAAYRGMLEVDRHPIAVLRVSCDPSQVDVNVHPTKREVRFRDEGAVFEAVQRACWEALQGARPSALAVGGPPPRADLGATGAESLAPGPLAATAAQQLPLGPDRRPGSGPLAGAAGWKFLGQAHNRYLVVETEDGLALLDQHAAHEKVLYERFRRALEGATSELISQGLLEAVLVEIPGGEGVGEDDLVALSRAGFAVEEFGVGVVRCTAAPSQLPPGEVAAALREALSSDRLPSSDPDLPNHRLAALLACHSAVRFGDPLPRQQVSVLLADLAKTSGAVTCPHGRPAILEISEQRLRSAFHRP